MGDLRRDLDNFHHRLKIKFFFDPNNATLIPDNSHGNSGEQSDSSSDSDTEPNDPTGNDSPITEAINRSKNIKNENPWQPSISPLPLKAFILANELDLNKTFVKAPHKANISPAQKSAIKSLSNNKEIVIKKADKGSSIVMQNRVDYITEGTKQLSDEKFNRIS